MTPQELRPKFCMQCDSQTLVPIDRRCRLCTCLSCEACMPKKLCNHCATTRVEVLDLMKVRR